MIEIGKSYINENERTVIVECLILAWVRFREVISGTVLTMKHKEFEGIFREK
jgi:hypothetical protein